MSLQHYNQSIYMYLLGLKDVVYQAVFQQPQKHCSELLWDSWSSEKDSPQDQVYVTIIMNKFNIIEC